MRIVGQIADTRNASGTFRIELVGIHVGTYGYMYLDYLLIRFESDIRVLPIWLDSSL